ncbi:DUF6036 family nucleotidyltransferase [Trueperella sp. LYQ143]|uniref:DUF6036 family nucleotidyltransferase n=1 Tax=Trueperella sp. LYQ143 TaxID=3391059 RepID=UPI0039832C37
MTDLSADTMRKIFNDLSLALEEKNISAEAFIVGGAAMALAYDHTRTTRDIDAVFSQGQIVHQLANQLRETYHLPKNWLNDAAKGFMPGNDKEAKVIFHTANLTVSVASPRYMLAMKLFSGRPGRDYQDAALLVNQLDLSSVEQCEQILQEYYPQRLLLPKHQYICAEVFDISKYIRQAPSRTEVIDHNEENHSRSIMHAHKPRKYPRR